MMEVLQHPSNAFVTVVTRRLLVAYVPALESVFAFTVPSRAASQRPRVGNDVCSMSQMSMYRMLARCCT